MRKSISPQCTMPSASVTPSPATTTTPPTATTPNASTTQADGTSSGAEGGNTPVSDLYSSTTSSSSEGRGTGGAGNAADDSVTTALVVAGAGPDNDNEEEDAPPPALPPRPPNLALPAMQSAMSTSPAATSTASAASQHPPHIGNSYSRRLEDGAANRTAPPSSSGGHYLPVGADADGLMWPRPRNRHHHPPGGGGGGGVCKSFARKYVLLCCFCGGLQVTLGALYLAIFFVLDGYTTSLHYFQTLPTYVPSIPLIITGILIILFSRRSIRNNYLMKLCGCLCLVSAVLCVVVTVTTTVIHMNRLQTLRECVYQAATRTCTCFAGIMDPITQDTGMHYIFAGTKNCDIIHGVLYSCLRALFGISVIGILVCIFSCMLVYQIQSHEKKKEYWDQLESRCRYLHRRLASGGGQSGHGGGQSSHYLHPHHLALPVSISAANLLSQSSVPSSHCECCAATVAAAAAAASAMGASDATFEENIWSSPSPLTPAGNLYTPNPTTAAESPLATAAASAVNAVNGGQQGGTATSPAEQGQVPLVSSSAPPSAEGHATASQSNPLVRSFRNFLRLSSSQMNRRGRQFDEHQEDGAAAAAAASNADQPAVAAAGGVVQLRSAAATASSNNPLWRRSHPGSSLSGSESAYGFHHLNHQHPHHPHHPHHVHHHHLPHPHHGLHARIYPASYHYLSTLAASAQPPPPPPPPSHPPNPPSYVWDPPPPYSQPQTTTAAAATATTATQSASATSSAPPMAATPSSLASSSTAIASNVQTTALATVVGSPQLGNLNGSADPKSEEGCMTPTSTSPKTTRRSSSTPRTTKSGLLPSSTALAKTEVAPDAAVTQSPEDDSIESAMHIYEKQPNAAATSAPTAAPPSAVKGFCYSLPSRRMAKKKKAPLAESAEWQQQSPPDPHDDQRSPLELAHLQMAKSMASIPDIKEEEELLVAEMRHKLNALLLYKYQHSKATRELAEVREALTNLHRVGNVDDGGQPATVENNLFAVGKNLPAGFTSAASALGYAGIRSAGIRQVGGRNRNSTSSGTSSIENKYETIEKSLSPYKITAAAAKAKAKIPSASMENVSAIPTKRHVNVSIRKQLELQHQVSTAAAVASSSTPTSPLCSTVGQIYAGMAMGPCSSPIRTTPVSSTPSSSHYAQISPLRGIGVPGSGGIATPTYFQEMLRRNEKSSSPSRRPLSPPVPHPRNPLFKSKPENNYPLNNNNGKDNSNSGVGVASRISQSTSGLNCLMLNNNGLDSNGSSGKALSGWRSDPRLSESNGSNFAIRHREPQQEHLQAARRRRLAGPPTGVPPTTPGRNKCKAVSPVYLRPEQNIPEVFAAARSTGFKPIISEATRQQPSSPSKDGGERSKKGNQGGMKLSRDDIVVTVRSAQV